MVNEIMWKQLTEEAMAEAFNGAELATLTARRRGEEVDPMPGILAGVAARIRGAIRAGGRARVQGSELDVPAALWLAALDILRYQTLLRFAMSIAEPRKLAYEQALKLLDDVAAGRFVLADEGSPKTPAPAWEGRPRRFGPAAKKGIIM